MYHHQYSTFHLSYHYYNHLGMMVLLQFCNKKCCINTNNATLKKEKLGKNANVKVFVW